MVHRSFLLIAGATCAAVAACGRTSPAARAPAPAATRTHAAAEGGDTTARRPSAAEIEAQQRQLMAAMTPEFSERLAADFPPCGPLPEAAAAVAAWPARAWHVAPLAGALRLPPEYAPDSAPEARFGAEQSWSAPGHRAVELTGLRGMLGLAMNAGGGRVVADSSCAEPLLGHRALVGRLLVVRPAGDTVFMTIANTVVRPMAGFQAIMYARSRADQRAQLAALRTVTLGAAVDSAR